MTNPIPRDAGNTTMITNMLCLLLPDPANHEMLLPMILEIWPSLDLDQRRRIEAHTHPLGRDGARLRMALDAAGVNIYDPTLR